MSPLEAAARFAAFVWFSETTAPTRANPEQARAFARENWLAFLPVADEGWGRLLIRVARTRARKRLGIPKRRPVAVG